MLEKIRDFVRPVSAALLVLVLVFGAIVSGALEAAFPGVGVRFTGGVAGWFIAIPGHYYDLLLGALGIYGVARTVEKAVSTYASAKYSPPGRTVEGDDIDPANMPRPQSGD